MGTDNELDTGKTGDTAEEIAAKAAAANEASPENGEQAAAAALETGEELEVGAVDEEKEPEQVPDWATKRFNKLTRQKYDEKTKADRLAGENEELRRENEKLKNAPAPLGDKPTLDKFDSEEEYFEALVDWKNSEREIKSSTSNQENTIKSQQETAEKDHNSKVDSMLSSGTGKHEDFMASVQTVPGNLFRHDVIAAIVEAENSEDVAYFLAKNLQEAEKISNMNGTQRAIAIGQISARLAIPITKKTSNAPDPIKPGGSQNNGPVDESKLSDDEWFAAQEAKRRAAAG